ncbi:hypothetical protein POX_g09042 [Penicillium oxalicum]|uniref:hypothetical protein n=1 Tax=Penicillium oxalicum TaxID=69781 RepID=UPI0020B7A7CE|nr:hypothetical protein POX_g09042 [Penicillium oxalicum]KAI2786654.1 hypothetical protein POX_g09042 [Penicillium oxalicum]
MTVFFEGSLQDGIAQAVRDSKAVVCFVRDNAPLSSTWEDEYFKDDEVAQLLRHGSVTLRLTAGSQEAGFLSSFCPIAEFPAVIVIKNGKLEEYLLPGISKEAFKDRLTTVLHERKGSQPTTSSVQQHTAIPAAANHHSSPVSSTTSPISTKSAPRQSSSEASPSSPGSTSQTLQPAKGSHAQQSNPAKFDDPPAPMSQPVKQEKRSNPVRHTKSPSVTPQSPRKPSTSKASPATTEETKPQPRPAVPRGPPTEYRLQVRLFDGRSIRSSFTPTQTIRNDVRPWLDQQMTDDRRPYNLKHVLTPLPSRTLSTSEESQALRDLGLGSTANLVMIPVASYTEAYASAATSLPTRGLSAVYGVVTSAASIATNLVGSFLGYASSATESSTQAPSASTAPVENAQRPRTGGPNIRTLHDQQGGRDDSQFYNGNQLNFEPRASERKND